MGTPDLFRRRCGPSDRASAAGFGNPVGAVMVVDMVMSALVSRGARMRPMRPRRRLSSSRRPGLDPAFRPWSFLCVLVCVFMPRFLFFFYSRFFFFFLLLAFSSFSRCIVPARPNEVTDITASVPESNPYAPNSVYRTSIISIISSIIILHRSSTLPGIVLGLSVSPYDLRTASYLDAFSRCRILA